MSFDVTWTSPAEDALTRIWLAARDRARVKSAADHVEAQLRIDPTHLGESRAGSTRVVVDDPLVVYFQVDEAAQEVSVFRIVRPH